MLSLSSISLLVFPLLVAATTVPAGVSQLLVPFSTLPLCAQQCGPLYDAQGACAATAVTSTSVPCFCAYTTLQGFKTSPNGVCGPTACTTSTDPNGDLTQIQSWFNSFCASGGSTTTVPTGAGTTSTAVPKTSNGAASTDNITWISGHWKYVVLLVVVFILIVLMWVGACFLRRRHVARRDRAFEMRPPAVPWGPHQTQAMTPPGVFYNEAPAAGKLSGVKAFYGGKGKSPLSKEVPVRDGQQMSVFEVDKGDIRKDRRWIPKERT